MTLNLRKTPRLYVTDDLATGLINTLAPEQSHYLRQVMRLKKGDTVRLFNGRHGEFISHIGQDISHKKQGLSLSVNEQIRPQNKGPDLWLCCAPIKRAHFDYMIMKATELGIERIQPILTAHTQVREVNTARCRAIAIEAAEQSERLTVPEILTPIKLERLIASWPEKRLAIVCAEFGDAEPVHKALSKPAVKASTQTAVITGPEGGFGPEELQALQKLPFSAHVRLGPRILRADTAALAALSCWQALCGDWQETT